MIEWPNKNNNNLLSVQFSSVAQSCLTLCNLMDCNTLASLYFTFPQNLLKLQAIESMMPSNHLILCRPFLLLPPIPPGIRVFSNESVLHIRWPKYWSFCFSISPSNEYSGLISFRIDWFDLLVVQGTLKSLLQHHSSKASIVQHSIFFIVQLSHPYMTTRKTIALTRWTFVGKVMSLLFNMLSRLVIAFLPRSKSLLISFLSWYFREILSWEMMGSCPLVSQLIKNPPGMQENWAWSLGCEDPLQKGTLPTPASWPGEFHELYSPWDLKELGRTEWLSLSLPRDGENKLIHFIQMGRKFQVHVSGY